MAQKLPQRGKAKIVWTIWNLRSYRGVISPGFRAWWQGIEANRKSVRTDI